MSATEDALVMWTVDDDKITLMVKLVVTNKFIRKTMPDELKDAKTHLSQGSIVNARPVKYLRLGQGWDVTCWLSSNNNAPHRCSCEPPMRLHHYVAIEMWWVASLWVEWVPIPPAAASPFFWRSMCMLDQHQQKCTPCSPHYVQADPGH